MVSVIKHFCLYVMGNLAVRGVSGLMTPVILHKIAPRDYGLLSLVSSAIAIATPLFGLGLRQVMSLEYFHCTAKERVQLINTIIGVYLICSLPLSLSTVLCWVCCQNCIPVAIVGIGLFITVLYFFVELTYQILRYEQQALTLSAIQLATAIITGVCTIALLEYSNLGMVSVLIGQTAGHLLTCILGLYYYYYHEYHHHQRLCINRATVGHYVRAGIIFIPNMLFAWILASSDRWFLAQYTSLGQVGIYSVADTCCQLFQTLILNAWAGSYLPMILLEYQADQGNLLLTERKNLKWMLICVSIGLFGIMLGYLFATPILTWILPNAYHPAISYIWILLAGQVALLGTYFSSTLIQFQKKRLFLSCGLLIPAFINILLNYLLIPRFGIAGCTTATLTAYCIYFVITLCYNLSIQCHIKQRSRHEANAPVYSTVYCATNNATTQHNPKPPDNMAQL